MYHQGYGQQQGYGPPPPQQQQQQGGWGPPPQQQPPYGGPPPQYGAPQASGHYGQQPGYGPPPGAPSQYGAQPATGAGHHPGYGAPPAPQPTPVAATPHPQAQADGADAAALQAWFAAVDTDRSGELDAAEIQRALSLGNLKFSVNEVDGFVRAFDTRGRRKLNLQEFSRLHAFLTSITSTFTYFDRDRSHTLQANEVTAALKHAGFNLDPPVVQALLSRHNNPTAGLSLDDFIRLCMFVQSCMRAFSAFDSQRTGQITLDIGQFIYAAAHVG